LNRRRVLIIDDDRETADLFSTVLGMVGYQCEVALTARTALARMAATVPDLILLDMHLGIEIGGEDILYQIRSNPRFDNTRVIVVTAHSSNANIVSELSDLVLLKPVDVNQLQTLVARIDSSDSGVQPIPFRDPITRMFNEAFYDTRLELAFERSRRRSDFLYAALVLQLQMTGVDVEELDSVVSSSILQEAADRLRSSLRPMDTIARFAGWKFATLHEELKDTQDAQVIITRILGRLLEPYSVGEDEYRLEVFFGVGLNNPRYKQAGDVLAAAERSLAEALEREVKHAGSE
jgi:PleD family two-component response regulator